MKEMPTVVPVDHGGVSHSANLCNTSNSAGGGGGLLDKLSDKSQIDSVSDIQISVHATQESNLSHHHQNHRFLDATTNGAGAVSHELRDSESSSSGPIAKSQNLLVGTTTDNRVKYWTNIIQGVEVVKKKCPWRIQIIDGTALIETTTSLLDKQTDISYGAKNERMLLGKNKKKKNKNKNKNNNSRVYSRKELEALRFQGLDAQNRRWVDVYSALGSALHKEEYDGLVVVQFHPMNIKTKNKTKKKKNVNVKVKVKVKVNPPLFQNQPSFLGPWVAKQEYHAKPLYNKEWATGKFERHGQNVF